jgi:peptidoglycan/LPS O-acetylase OafA/YrhL
MTSVDQTLEGKRDQGHEASRSNSLAHLPLLDGVRAFAIFAVMLYHANWLQCGWVGVQAFFVLSGLLITRILLKSKERWQSSEECAIPATGSIEYFSTFYWRRMLRIFPLYYVFIGGLTLIYLVVGHPVQLKTDLPWMLTYATNIQRTFSGYHNTGTHSHLWSLAVEEQFYLIWPAVVWLLSRRQLRNLTWGLIAGGPILRFATGWWATHQWHSQAQAGEVVYNLFSSHLDAFACGAAVAMGSAVFCANTGRKLAVSAAVTLAVGLGLLLIYLRPLGVAGFNSLGYPHNMPWKYGYVWGYSLWNLTFALSIAVLCQSHLEKRGVFRVLELPFIAYLGRISYGLYVFHNPIQVLVARLWHIPEYRPFPLDALLVSIAATIAIAVFSFHTLESWFLKLKDRQPRWNPPFVRAEPGKETIEA